MDLNPRIILIFQETQNGQTHYIWKLSGQDGEAAKGFNSFDGDEPIISRRGEGTYLAPESISSTPGMTSKSDVWSLGCVISVVFAYLEGGSAGIEHYGLTRLEHRVSDGYDRFFVRGKVFTSTNVNPAVKSQHTHLIDKARQRNRQEGDAVEFMLRYLEKRVFEVTQSKRDNAMEVEKRLLGTFRKYETLKRTRDEDRVGARGMPFWPNARDATRHLRYG
ncbi:hypothetical protein PITC_069770 [Penicillium italicum]|uniref:Protein kinase domain-containing protein n=1 Tax=Penicillium italicum TaxID=40296 RepID=A0A0A2L4S2_PENIT|nr:hypothetical protein PITC_069770 [Penicillium italicum]